MLGTVFSTAVALAMDATAVAASNAIRVPHVTLLQSMTMALVFGIFQAGMTVIGYAIGAGAGAYVGRFDGWMTFALLGAVGAKMLYEGMKRVGDEDCAACAWPGPRTVLALGVATSLDALATGTGLALIEPPPPLALSACLIGAVTLLLSAVGAGFGKRLGPRFGRWAEIVGGAVLIGLGTKILVQRLNG